MMLFSPSCVNCVICTVMSLETSEAKLDRIAVNTYVLATSAMQTLSNLAIAIESGWVLGSRAALPGEGAGLCAAGI